MSSSRLLQDQSLAFALRVIKLKKYLISEWREFPIADQICRSGTSIAANIAEAQGAQSTADFITKLHIALTEAREVEAWLEIIRQAEFITEHGASSLKRDLDNIIGLLVVILKKVKDNNRD